MQGKFVTLPGDLKIHFLTQGDNHKPPLLLLHGWPSGAFLWRHLIPELSRHFHVLAPDLPGHGESDKPPGTRYDLDFLRGFIVDYMDALDLSCASVACHDLGGMATLSFAVKYPQRLHRLIVMNTSPYPEWSFLLSFTIGLLKRKSLTRLFLIRRVFKQVLKNGFYNPSRITPDVLDLYRAPWIASPAGRTAFSQAIAVPPSFMVESEDRLRTISAPTLLLWGSHDRFFPLGVARRLQRDIRNSSLVSVARAGHFLPEEQPEFILRHMIPFLMNQS